jgi:tRNA modification GTPase
MIELHLHGSKAVVEAVFNELKQMKMRMAQRGEITKRAVTNGKLSLNQAEAINDLINSENEFTRQVSINNLLGKNMNYIETLREELVKSLTKC